MDFYELIFRIKLVAAVFSLIFGALTVFFIVKFHKLVGFKIEKTRALIKARQSGSGGPSYSRWGEIERHIESDREAEWKFAIIEADKLVDDVLKRAGYPGDTMGERLMNVPKDQLVAIDGLWEAHKIRNKVVHDSNYFLRYGEAKRAFGLYKKALEEIGVVT